jgi:hypothetical protein
MLSFALISLCLFHGAIAFSDGSAGSSMSDSAELFLGLFMIMGLVADGLLVRRSYTWDPDVERLGRFVLVSIIVLGGLLDADDNGFLGILASALGYGLHSLFIYRLFTYEIDLPYLGLKTLFLGMAALALEVLTLSGANVSLDITKLCILANVFIAGGYAWAFAMEINRGGGRNVTTRTAELYPSRTPGPLTFH